MKKILTFSLVFLFLGALVLCKKTDKDKNHLLLFGFLLSQSSAACNPQSGFTICIPKGIAE